MPQRHRDGLGGLNDQLSIAQDADYTNEWRILHSPSSPLRPIPRAVGKVVFQAGDWKEVGVNGISTECLIALTELSLERLNIGEYEHHYTTKAIRALAEARYWLQKRTKERHEENKAGKQIP